MKKWSDNGIRPMETMSSQNFNALQNAFLSGADMASDLLPGLCALAMLLETCGKKTMPSQMLL
jgi:hypothetical protein